jgi:hypothetical protein
MPEYLAPGVYVEEIEIGPKSIEGVGTSTAAFIGECERGPTEPTLVVGLEQYRRLFGSYAWTQGGAKINSFMRHAVEGFFSNGGKRCFITRVIGNGAQPASIKIRVLGGGKAEDAPVFEVKALGPGSWGNKVVVKVSKASVEKMPGVDATKLFRAVVQYWKEGESEETEAKQPKMKGNRGPTPWGEEVYDNLSVDPKSPDYVVRRVSSHSSLISVDVARLDKDEKPVDVEKPKSKDPVEDWSKAFWLAKGSDGASIKLEQYKGSDTAGERTGLAALETVDEVAIVCAPNAHELPGLDRALVAHCENLKDRFAVLQAPDGQQKMDAFAPPTDSMFAAFYYPWIKVIDGGTGLPRFIPPVGHVAGIYARTDIERGVHKAPANEVVRGALGLQVEVTRGDQELLNPRGVNCIRAFPGRGIRVWGARTMSSDPLWKYINVRRLFNYLEESIEEATQWVVFEPNNERLWSRVRQTISGFLTTVWRDGALMGRTAEEAFFVKCDRTTMTDNDIETGRLIVLIGVAPVRPAEFVIFRIAQWRGGSSIEE